MRRIFVLAFGVLLTAACSPSRDRAAGGSGALSIIVETDLSIPKDIDHVRLQVTQAGRLLLDVEKDVGAGALLLPAEFRVKGTGDASPVKVQGVGYKAGEPRVERDAITPIPSDYVGALRLALDYLCIGTARATAVGDVTSTCPDGLTCIEGSCRPSKVPPSVVPAEKPVDGGAAGCFDVAACFGTAQPASVDPTDCTLALPAGIDPSTINVALEYAPGTGGGVCTVSGCWVVFDRGSDVTVSGTTVTLPQGACDKGAGGAWKITTACLPKTEAEPECGDWSSDTTPVVEPPPPMMGTTIAESCDGPRSQPCGRCGTETRTCTNGTWSDWSSCSGEGVCEPKASQSCGTHGTQTCTDSCEWGPCGCAKGAPAL